MHASPARRRAAIYELIMKRGEVSVDHLSSVFSLSAETIRRDLGTLADSGHIQKIHGGAKRLPCDAEGAFDERMVRNTHAKKIIAEKLKAIVAPRQSIFMDTGSTTLICAQELVAIPQLTVITNSVAIAETLTKASGTISVHLLGGTYRHGNSQTVGPATVHELAGFRVDQGIITVAAIDSNGLWDYSHDESVVARAMVSCSNRVTVVADHTKFDHTATYKVCGWMDIDCLVTDELPDDVLSSALDESKVHVL